MQWQYSCLTTRKIIMSKGTIKESQQAKEGISIGTQGNQGGGVPETRNAPAGKSSEQEDRHIPNQQRSQGGSPRRNRDEGKRE